MVFPAAQRQIRIRLSALPFRSASGCDHYVRGQPLPSAGGVFLGGAQVQAVQVVAAFEFGGFKLSASLLYIFVHDVLRSGSGRVDDRHNLSPSVIASWKPFRNTDLEFRAFYKKSYRMPTFNDLYYTFTGVSWLEPEETTQYDFGTTWSLIRRSGWFRGVDVQCLPRTSSGGR